MRKAELFSMGPAVGFVLLDDAFNPIVLNKVAAEILTYPQPPNLERDMHRFWAEKVHSALIGSDLAGGSSIVPELRSGKRRYVCRSSRLDAQIKGYTKLSVAILLERESSGSLSLTEVARSYLHDQGDEEGKHQRSD
jgi:hypothetical protein